MCPTISTPSYLLRGLSTCRSTICLNCPPPPPFPFPPSPRLYFAVSPHRCRHTARYPFSQPNTHNPYAASSLPIPNLSPRASPILGFAVGLSCHVGHPSFASSISLEPSSVVSASPSRLPVHQASSSLALLTRALFWPRRLFASCWRAPGVCGVALSAPATTATTTINLQADQSVTNRLLGISNLQRSHLVATGKKALALSPGTLPLPTAAPPTD